MASHISPKYKHTGIYFLLITNTVILISMLASMSQQELEIYCSSFENIEQKITKYLQQAQQEICITSMTMNNTRIMQLLCTKSRNNINIVVLLDKAFYNKDITEVLGNKVTLILIPRNTLCKKYFHPKIIVIDQNTTIISTGNMTSHIQSQFNIICVINHASTAKLMAINIKTKLYEGFPIQDLDMEILFLPWNSTELLAFISSQMKKANTTLWVNRWISNKTLLRTKDLILKQPNKLQIIEPSKKLHSKYMLIDKTLIIGSFNFSDNAFNNNLEVVLIIHTLPDYLIKKLYHDFEICSRHCRSSA